MVVNNALNEEEFQRIMGGFAQEYRKRRNKIEVVDSARIDRSRLESIAITTFTNLDYAMNITMGDDCGEGDDYGEIETGVEVKQDLPDLETNILLADVLHQIMLREKHEETNSKVKVNMQVTSDGIKGSIYIPERTMQNYTEAAHFLKKVISTYGSDPRINLPQLLDIGYEHIGGTGYEAPEGYAIDFILQPELTRVTLRAGDDDLPLENTEILDGNGFQVRRYNQYLTCVEYSRNPLREELELPTVARHITKDADYLEEKN